MARSALLLGTCRVHDPTVVIRERFRLPVRRTPHRLHTPMQTLQFIRFMIGAQAPYTQRNVHLLSDRATADVLLGRRTPAQILDELARLRTVFSRFECLLIEISSLREHWVDYPDGTRFYVNTFCRRDLDARATLVESAIQNGTLEPVRAADIQSGPMTASQLLPVMKEIGDLVQRPILWISHMRPSVESPEYDTVNRVRKHLSDALAANAARLGHHFFDPTTQVSAVGRERFLAKDGTDLDHLSDLGCETLATIYRGFIASV